MVPKLVLFTCGILTVLTLCSYFFIKAPNYTQLIRASDVEYQFRLLRKDGDNPEHLFLPYRNTRWDPDDTPELNNQLNHYMKHMTDPYTRSFPRQDELPPLVNGMFHAIAKEQMIAPAQFSFEQARESYKTTTGRCPPPQFKEMYLGALAKGEWDELLVDQVTQQIKKLPKGQDLQAALKEALKGPGIEGIRISNGTVERSSEAKLSDVSQRTLDGFMTMVGSVSKYLPDMELALNVEPFPRVLKFPKRLKELRKELTKGTLWAVPEGYDLDRYVGEMCAGIKAEALRGVFRDGLLGGGSPLTYSEACYIRNDWGKTPVVSAITMLPVFSDFTSFMHSDIVYPSYDFYAPELSMNYQPERDIYHMEKNSGVSRVKAGDWGYLKYQKALVRDTKEPAATVSVKGKRFSKKSLDNHAFLGALKSRSTVLRASRWRTWLDLYTTNAWVSFIPVQLSGNDTEVVTKLLSERHTTAVGQAFASRGARDVRYRATRKKIELSLYYMLLEYHRRMYDPEACEDEIIARGGGQIQ
ncbi:hypothetical protein B0I73DRAFT_14664 [Yarrowia lipolytica]|uniref:Glycosyl transferase CAP10 domain-containing protein n=1 Tax=Yarrowia lipolytica TaxID=4952 RepID=A0A371C1D0_YARLL|nr:hypothetical protein B0I71DRAFT_5872 [Yarrowia lipolytica]RDW36815.1 hypothetical protein B0I73DRAFT_14664 [Yarrowia lipolytica]RDW44347.1 hypothetical protein B0I74DRAFT_47574 [Yarrowia lipolytica]RDW51162.1 hypothetical protein B0I75DRAFT_45555 [Yarrowia lipolytica]